MSSEARNVTWTIAKAQGSLNVDKTSLNLTSSSSTGTITASRVGDGVISATSNNTSVATVSVNQTSGVITVNSVANGDAVITVSCAEGTNYTKTANKTVNVNVSLISNILNENSWATISQVAQAGTGDTYWDVGDCKEITLNGKVGSQLTLSNKKLCVFILHFNYPDNKTTAMNNIVFGGFKTAVTGGVDVALCDNKLGNSSTDGTIIFNMSHKLTVTGAGRYGYNYGGWKGSDLRYDILGATSTAPSQYNIDKDTSCVGYDATASTLTSPKANTLLAALPSDLRSKMRLWTRYVDNVGGGSYNVDTNVTACVDAISLLAEFEVQGSRSWANDYEKNHQVQMAYYANGNTKVKKKYTDTSSSVNWWMCSPDYNDSRQFCVVNGVVGGANYDPAFSSGGVAPAFIV